MYVLYTGTSIGNVFIFFKRHLSGKTLSMNNHVGHVSMIQYHLPLPSDSAVQTAFQHVFFVDAYKHKLEVCLFLAGTSSIHDSLTLSR